MSDDIIINNKKPIIYSIYKINLNDKVYIGYTRREPLHRIKEHIYVANCVGKSHKIENTTILKHAIRKYGAESLTYEVLATTLNQDIAITIEEMFITLYDSTNTEKGYNLLRSGSNYDPLTRNREFYKDEKYRKLRSEVVSGEKNGRYTGITDSQIIEKAIEYYHEHKNIYITPWLIFCKTIGYPQGYDRVSSFRFRGKGVRGFSQEFLKECKKRNIDVKFEEFVSKLMRGKKFMELFYIYQEYKPEFTMGDVPIEYQGKWKPTPSTEVRALAKIEKNLQRSIYIANKEQELINGGFQYLIENNHLHYKKWQNYRTQQGTGTHIPKYTFGGRNHAGLCEKVLDRCLTENIKVELSQLTCIARAKLLNIDLLNVYDNYKKTFEAKTCI